MAKVVATKHRSAARDSKAARAAFSANPRINIEAISVKSYRRIYDFLEIMGPPLAGEQMRRGVVGSA